MVIVWTALICVRCLESASLSEGARDWQVRALDLVLWGVRVIRGVWPHTGTVGTPSFLFTVSNVWSSDLKLYVCTRL